MRDRTWLSWLSALPRPLLWITVAGVGARFLFSVLFPLVWKLHAVFNVFELGLLPYMSNFASYKPSRMPFFDVLSAAGYAVFSPLLGVQALLIFNILLAVAAIPAFYLAVTRLFDQRVAIPAALLFALYPKYVVLTSSGLPEAASLSFLALALYAFTRSLNSGQLTHYFVTGVLILLTYLMFTPAVAVGVLFVVFLYTQSAYDGASKGRLLPALLPTRPVAALSAAPGIVGIVYLRFGPVSSLLADVSANRLSVFVDPAAYSIIEKIFWYLAYTFFDFWWHTRGFDRERGIQPTIQSLQGFFSDLFPIYLLGWMVITLALTVGIVMGVGLLFRRRKSHDLLLLTWIGLYVVAYNYKNLGWVGGFQTRHVSAVFPALCVAFGFGAVAVTRRLRRTDLPFAIPDRSAVLTTGLIILGLSVLLVNGAAQGIIENDKRDEAVVKPVTEVAEIVDDDSVGAVLSRDSYNLMLYSENRVRPTILTDTPDRQTELRARFDDTVKTDLIKDPLLRTANVSYLYLRVERAYVDRLPYTVSMNETRIKRLRSTHETVYYKRINNGPFRTTSIDIYLLRLNGSSAGE